MSADLPIIPALPWLLGAITIALFPKKWRPTLFLFFPLLSLYLVWSIPIGSTNAIQFLGHELVLCEMSSLTRLFGTIFSVIGFIGGVYSWHRSEIGHQIAALLYAGGAIGLTFAGDYFTLFVFWEVMAVASTWFVWARGQKDSRAAGIRYLMVHLFGGGLLMTGILLHVTDAGTLMLQALPDNHSFAAWLILAGVALNTAIPPLHAWLADAYPRATVGGAVFMSALTTKSAVLVLIKLFAGWEILVYGGVIMALYGVVYAVLANDIRAILAYHIISQVGYMVAAVGMGTEMAINGACAHAFSHILYKALLFMGAGVVLETTGRSKLTELGGLSKAMPIVLWLYMIGAFSISGFPLFNGFISKSMIVAAAGKAHLDGVLLLLLLASVGTFLHTGLKLPYFTWWNASKEPITPTRTPGNMMVAMGIAASLCTLFGIAPGLLYQHLPYPVVYQPYSLYHLTETVQILVFTFVAFWIMRGKLAGEPYLPIDTDWVYRKPGKWIAMQLVDGVNHGFAFCEACIKRVMHETVTHLNTPESMIQVLAKKERHSLHIELLLIIGSLVTIAAAILGYSLFSL